jgi:hypothetical protein
MVDARAKGEINHATFYSSRLLFTILSYLIWCLPGTERADLIELPRPTAMLRRRNCFLIPLCSWPWIKKRNVTFSFINPTIAVGDSVRGNLMYPAGKTRSDRARGKRKIFYIWLLRLLKVIRFIPVLFLEYFCQPVLFYHYIESLLNLIKNIGDNSETLPSASHVGDMDRTNNLDRLIHNSSKWANWLVIMNCMYGPGVSQLL